MAHGRRAVVPTLIAVTQAGDVALFDAHLRWLTRGELRGPLLIALNAFASALLAHGQMLPPEKAAVHLDDAAAPLTLRVVAR